MALGLWCSTPPHSPKSPSTCLSTLLQLACLPQSPDPNGRVLVHFCSACLSQTGTCFTLFQLACPLVFSLPVQSGTYFTLFQLACLFHSFLACPFRLGLVSLFFSLLVHSFVACPFSLGLISLFFSLPVLSTRVQLARFRLGHAGHRPGLEHADGVHTHTQD